MIYDPTEYEKLMKDHCAICTWPMENSWARYMHVGNTCDECARRVYYGSSLPGNEHYLTPEEVQEDLAKRIKEKPCSTKAEE